ncbi:MAG TPA: PAS domain S-box protein [Pirellulales bacterium]
MDDAKNGTEKDEAEPSVAEQTRRLSEPPAAPGRSSHELEEDLRKTKASLASAIAALQDAETRLKISNEEMTALNDDLQTINAELESAKKQANDAGQKERLLATVLMDTSDAIVVHDFQGRISTWNRGAEQLYGYSESEALRMNIDRLIPASSRAAMRSVWARIEHGEQVQSREAQCITRSGQTVDIWVTFTALNDPNGRPAAIAKIARDITERLRAHERLEEEVAHRTAALNEQQKRLRAILDSTSDAILTIDSAGKIESVNRATERIFGYAADEMIGQSVTMLMPAPDRDERDHYILHDRQTGERRMIGVRREAEARRKDGTIFPAELAISEIEDLNLFTGMVRDITDRKTLEREVVAVAQLEQQRVGQDLHDECGQQLTALALLADSLIQSLSGTLPDDAELARKIEDGLKDVLRQVRDIARGLTFGEVRPEMLSTALAELSRRLCDAANVRCTIDIAKGLRAHDISEATHLYHIAQEACTNALKHAQPGAISMRLFPVGEAVVLEVRDDGVGMPHGDRREGVGLRIMRNRASIIGAELTITPVEPHGTLVTCTCPKRTPDSSRKTESHHGRKKE